MYISQCLIVKNEEENIEYCLSHLKSVVDEQIVVDTGSTDRTVEIAEKMGAKVFHFDWINDFSAARNYTLKKAKGDWIIFLDCDEYFNESSVPLIKKTIIESARHKNTDGIMCELINIDKNKNILSVVKNVSARIFKNNKNIKYKNKVHEILYNDKRENSYLNNLDAGNYLKILHTGYDKEVMIEKGKLDKYINILKEELAEKPEDSQINLYLSTSLYIDGKYKESLEYAFEALKYMDKDKNMQFYPNIYSNILYAMIPLSTPYDEMKIIFDEAISAYPKHPDYYRAMGTVASANNNIKLSIEYFEKCIDFCKKYTSSVESLALGQIKDIYKLLLNEYIRDENKNKMVEITVTLLNADKYDYKILTILIHTFLTGEKEEVIIKFLSKIYDYTKFKDKIYLLKASKAANSEILVDFYKSLLNEEELKVVDEN